MKKIILIITLISGLAVRLYKINSPVADWHSFRQADTASVSYLFQKNGIDLLHPRYFDTSNIQSGQDNPQGWRMVEFPIYNAISVLTHHLTGLNIDTASRLASILFSLATAYLIFLVTKDLTKKFLPSYLALSAYLFLPFSIFYSRAILPESTANFFMVLAIYLFKRQLFLSAISLALAILVKPYTALISFPLLLFYSGQKLLSSKKQLINLILFAVIALAPFALWRFWIQNFPTGIPKSDWLFNGGNIRFRPAWFRWLFFERLGKLILGVYGVIPLFTSFNHRKTLLKNSLLWLGILTYFIVIARGNVQHDYYQFLIIPFLAISLGIGLSHLKPLFILGISALSLSFSWYQVKDYYAINNPVIIQAGQKIQELTPENTLVIAPYNGDTAFLYQTKRFGWPIEIYDLATIRSLHPDLPIFLVSTTLNDYTIDKINSYPIIFQSPDFIILDLTHDQT